MEFKNIRHLLIIFGIPLIAIFNGYILFFGNQTGITPSEIEAEAAGRVFSTYGIKDIKDYACTNMDNKGSLKCIDGKLEIKLQHGIILHTMMSYLMFGDSVKSPFIYFFIFALISCVFIYIISNRFFSKNVSIVFSLCFLLLPSIMYRNNFIFGSYAGFILFLRSLYAYLRFMDTRNVAWIMFTGLFLATAFLMRIENVIGGFFMGICILIYDRKYIFKYYQHTILTIVIFAIGLGPFLYVNSQLNESPFRLGYTQKALSSIETDKGSETSSNPILQNLSKFPLIRYPVKSMNLSETYNWIDNRLQNEMFVFSPFFIVLLIIYLNYLVRIKSQSQQTKLFRYASSLFGLVWFVSEITGYHRGWNIEGAVSYYSRYWSLIYFILLFALFFKLKSNYFAILLFTVYTLIYSTSFLTTKVKSQLIQKNMLFGINNNIASIKLSEPNIKCISEFYNDKLFGCDTIIPFSLAEGGYEAMFQKITLGKDTVKEKLFEMIESENTQEYLVVERPSHRNTYLNLMSFFTSNGLDVEIIKDPSIGNVEMFIVSK